MAKYIINKSIILQNISKLKESFCKKGLTFDIFYSVKTNPGLPILDIIKDNGCYFEIVSEYEWSLVKKLLPRKIILNGPGKHLDYIKDMINIVDELYVNIDNDTDLEIIKNNKIYEYKNVYIGVRVYLNKGNIWNRFGFNVGNLEEKIKGLEQHIKGFHFHFNTNNFSVNNYENILEELYKFTNNKNISLKYLDIGGGLPGANEFIYHDEIFNKLPELIFKYFPQTYILGEPGRYIIGNGVSLKSTVISKNMENNKYKVSIDTNIMHFPCYFEKKYNIEYNTKQNNIENSVSNIEIFGNSCMQIDKIGDVIIKGKPDIGDEIIINNIGAYSFSQASNFISLIPNFEIYE